MINILMKTKLIRILFFCLFYQFNLLESYVLLQTFFLDVKMALLQTTIPQELEQMLTPVLIKLERIAWLPLLSKPKIFY